MLVWSIYEFETRESLKLTNIVRRGAMGYDVPTTFAQEYTWRAERQGLRLELDSEVSTSTVTYMLGVNCVRIASIDQSIITYRLPPGDEEL
jgi:hypothetical protein